MRILAFCPKSRPSKRKRLQKDDEISRLSQENIRLRTNFEEKVHIEAERRIHLYIPEIIREIKEGFISKLSTSWEITCDKCHQRFPVTLTSEGVAMLLKEGYVYVECLNTNCKDAFLFFQYPHRIKLKLQTFVKAVIEEKFEKIYMQLNKK
ncbi:MAG: hypothetical protein QXR19_16915 [Candidatus Jordarchaeaceae archaeon]